MKYFLFTLVISLLILSVGCRPGDGGASCRPGKVTIITREEWGALPPDTVTSEEGAYDPLLNPGGWQVYEGKLSKTLKTIVVHHSALPLTDGPLEIQRMHMEVRGYADIAYHFVIDEKGTINEGRDIHVRGAHTGGFNTGSVGVVLLGNFEDDEPTSEQLESLQNLSCNLALKYRITHLAGHRDFQPDVTVCPGQNLYVHLPQMADELGLAMGTGGYTSPLIE